MSIRRKLQSALSILYSNHTIPHKHQHTHKKEAAHLAVARRMTSAEERLKSSSSSSSTEHRVRGGGGVNNVCGQHNVCCTVRDSLNIIMYYYILYLVSASFSRE